MRKTFLAVAISVAMTALMWAQAGAQKTVDNEFVHQQFGDQFTYLPQIGVSVGDLDGDGIEDIVIAARCKNPMIDAAQHDFKVVDPLNSFYGYGDPRLTTTFAEGDPSLRGLVMLIIHGAGPDAWHSAKPKGKYVVVNLPFKSLSVRKMALNKKRMIEAIYVEEAGELGECSAVFFDPKKFNYMYVPMGGNMN
ncbi:MAG: FG-GAP repeat protein [Terriglobales bacterium]|jgi:hypothetical protein